jgi:hypothetical protein
MSHAHDTMSDREWYDANQRAAQGVPRLELLCGVLILLGVIGFALGGGGHRNLHAYWVNFLFWGGLAQAGVTWASIVYVARGNWGGTLIRLGLLQVLFTPVTLILFLGIIAFGHSVFPWVGVETGKEWWLNLPELYLRVGLALLVLTLFNLNFAYWVLRPEAGALAQIGPAHFPALLTKGWRGTEAERARSVKILMRCTPLHILAYVITYTLLAFDLVMSLEWSWFSTLFGGYFFITTLYIGIAAIILWATFLRPRLGLEGPLSRRHFHDIGKLMLGFCLLSAYMGWSQYIVIWYGDLYEETQFIMHRVGEPDPHSEVDYSLMSGEGYRRARFATPEWDFTVPWVFFTRAVLIGGFLLPFLILLVQRLKMVPTLLALVALLPLFAGFLERHLLVLPPLREGATGMVFGVTEILITLGFLGLYGLCVLAGLRRGVVVAAPWKFEPLCY